MKDIFMLWRAQQRRGIDDKTFQVIQKQNRCFRRKAYLFWYALKNTAQLKAKALAFCFANKRIWPSSKAIERRIIVSCLLKEIRRTDKRRVKSSNRRPSSNLGKLQKTQSLKTLYKAQSVVGKLLNNVIPWNWNVRWRPSWNTTV